MDDPSFELLGDLSTEDFQQKLYNWLEERGTLPVLRTYLRHQLISTLKHTHPRSTLLSRKGNHLSPKTHAINLLVAEHLLEQNYHFTASIFHSEEPHLGRLPSQFESLSEVMPSSNYLQLKDIEDILGTLNVGVNSKFGKKVIDIYFSEKKSNKSTSLLKSVFQALCESNIKWNVGSKLSAGDTGRSGNNMCVDQMMYPATSAEPGSKPTNADIPAKIWPPGNIPRDKRSSASQGEDLKEHLMEWNKREFERQIKEEVRKVREELENETVSQKQKLKEDLTSKQQQFLELLSQLRNQQAQVKLHLEQIENKEEELKEKEERLLETQKQEAAWVANKHNDIVRAHQKMMEDFKRLTQEQSTIKCLKKETESWVNQVVEGIQSLGHSPSALEPQSPQQRRTNNKDLQQQAAAANASNSETLNLIQSMRSLQEKAIRACHQTIGELKDKNETLQSVAEEQQSKIDTLSSTATQLSKQLEEARAALRLLSSQDGQPSDVDPRRRAEEQLVVLSLMHGDGEKARSAREDEVRQKGFTAGGSSSSGFYWEKSTRKHSRGSRQMRHSSHDSDSSEASSPTEEIIQEARRRLERLEKESDEVDRQFFKIRQKHMVESSGNPGLVYSAIFPGTIHNIEQGVPLYDFQAAGQNAGVSGVQTFQSLHGNVPSHVVADARPSLEQDTQFLKNQAPEKNQSHFSKKTHLNSVSPHLARGSQQTVHLNSVNQLSNPGVPPVGSTYNNNTPMDSYGNTYHKYATATDCNNSKTAQTSPLHLASEAPIGKEKSEANFTYRNNSKQFLPSQYSVPTKEIQRSVHFESVPNRRTENNDHITEKNNLSVTNMGCRTNNRDDKPEEQVAWKSLERSALVIEDPKPLLPAVNLKDNHQTSKKSDFIISPDSREPVQQVTMLESHISVSTAEDTSSPKLSIGINDSKDDDNSDLW